MNIYLIRHGETEWNKKAKMQGQVDIPLAPEGIEQAKITAEGMAGIPFDYIFSSPLKRAYETARIIRGDRQIPIETDDRLKEMSFGIAEGRNFNKIKRNPAMVNYQRFFKDPVHFRPAKYGERFEDILKRTDEFFREKVVPMEGKAENILIAAHGCVVRSFIVNLNQRPLKMFWETPFGKNCSTALFSCVDGKIEMIYENKLYY
ncbi:MAG: histidine phosphatase family protein [Eubacterium sp.]|nr:histidine phosphatase family protein [Eubacterium sp.]MDD7210321.1 histidine phosphatase family protein [Lachnospiraceae bacterium]MDY5496875.1 histidine phosphatase family protein [Anaerobutyricum sp.]